MIRGRSRLPRLRRPRGEFTRARLRLTAWYAGLLIVVLAAVGVLATVLMTQRLDDQVNAALVDEVLAVAPRLGQLVDSGSQAPLPLVQPAPAPASGGADESAERDGDDDGGPNDRVLHELAESGQVPTHQLLLGLNGALLESTLTAAAMPLPAPITAASQQRVDVRTIRVESERIRVRTQQVFLDGAPIGYVQAFHSLEARDETAADLIQIFLIAGGIAGAGALLAGFWLSGRALAPIQRNLEAQERFIADASHELRTPIAVVQSSADVLLRHPDHRIDEEQEVVEGIAEEAARMGALVRDLLDLGTVDQTPLDRTEVDLRAIAEEAARALARIAGERSVAIEVAPGDPSPVLGDSSALLQVVRILIDNAIRHTGPDTRVVVTLRRAGAFAELRVADDGPGIPPEEHGRVFERFARVDKARARAQGSSGLGLSIARALVTRHGGTIALESVPGEGATFSVRLPAAG